MQTFPAGRSCSVQLRGRLSFSTMRNGRTRLKFILFRLLGLRQLKQNSRRLLRTRDTYAASFGAMKAGIGVKRRGRNNPCIGGGMRAAGRVPEFVGGVPWDLITRVFISNGTKPMLFADGQAGGSQRRPNGRWRHLGIRSIDGSAVIHGATILRLLTGQTWIGQTWIHWTFRFYPMAIVRPVAGR